jgi:hypothetical protein
MPKTTITPKNESLAMIAAIQSLKMGSKRRCFAERTRAANPYDDRAVIIAFPSPAAALPVAANN